MGIYVVLHRLTIFGTRFVAPVAVAERLNCGLNRLDVFFLFFCELFFLSCCLFCHLFSCFYFLFFGVGRGREAGPCPACYFCGWSAAIPVLGRSTMADCGEVCLSAS